MNKEKTKRIKQAVRKRRIRAKISGTNECPRLNVFKSNTGLFLQLIDDAKGVTLASVSSKEVKEKAKGMKKTELSMLLGKEFAEKIKALKIESIVFDRGGNRYHGRVKAVADGLREGGLSF